MSQTRGFDIVNRLRANLDKYPGFNNLNSEAATEIEHLRTSLAAAEAANERLRKVLNDIATPGSNSFYILRDGERVLVAEWSAVQWRMDFARAALGEKP